MGLRFLVMLVDSVMDRANGSDTGGGNADFQPVLVGDGNDDVELEGVELVLLGGNGHALAAVFILRILYHHQELVVPNGNALRPLRFSRVLADGVKPNTFQLIRLVIANAGHLDAHRHIVFALSHALDGQRMDAAIGQFLQRDRIILRPTDRTVGAGDVQDTPRRIVGQKAGADVGYCRVRPAHDFSFFCHALPPNKN